MIFTREKVEELLVHCRLSDAAAFLTVARADSSQMELERRAARAGTYAISGDDRGLARLIAPELLAWRTAESAEYHAAQTSAAGVYDHLCGGIALAWSGDANGAYDALARAHDLANAEGRFHLAVAARERLAHHALLFGEVERARSAIDDAIVLARNKRLKQWLVRALAIAARLSLDAGDRERGTQILARGRAEATTPETLALFAPAGAQLAVELGDDVALQAWISRDVLDVALNSEATESVVAATIALLIGSGTSPPSAKVTTALRRALLQTDAASAPDLFSLAARHGELEEARVAPDALASVFAPQRAYLQAHHLLARAHVLMRTGQPMGWVDSASDAARAFNSMGLRRWTNDAMMLLVAQEPISPTRRRRERSTGSVLTGREQQVAHLIRRGARNREVAVALQISEHTVERHVSSILGRLGLRSRWQIVDPGQENGH